MTRPDGPAVRPRGGPARGPEATQPAPTPDDDENSDITGAYRLAKAGSAKAGSALDAKTKRAAVAVALVIAFFTAINLGANVLLYNRSITESVQRSNTERLNGAAQQQARRALDDSAPANAKLKAEGLFSVPIDDPYKAPASDVIANTASVQVLADMDPNAIMAEDYVALGQSVRRFYARQPTITQFGPSPLKTQQLCQQYLRVAAELKARGLLPLNRPRGR